MVGIREWRDLNGLTQRGLADAVSEQFRDELGYDYVNWWPVYLRPDEPKKAFVLVHASDHEDAWKLMRRAFEKVFGKRWGSPVDGQAVMFPDEV